MRALIQRVKQASVVLNGVTHQRIGRGLLVFLGVAHSDHTTAADYLARKCADLRIFDDAEGKMNLSVKDIAGDILVISQFTLFGDTSKGNRPNFMKAAPPEQAETLYNRFIMSLQQYYPGDFVRSGIFRAMMEIELINDGPMTVQIESKNDQL